MAKWLIASLMLFAAVPAFAHSSLRQSTPADQAVISAAPETLEMSFSDAIRLTRVDFGPAGGNMSELDLGKVSGFVTDYSLTLDPVGPGLYRVEWRGLGVDGHAMKGLFEFSVK